MPASHHNHPEAAERSEVATVAPVLRGKPSWRPTPEQQGYIDFIAAWQARENVTDAELAGHTKCEATGKARDASTWHKIRSGKYPGKNNGPLLLADFQKGMENCVAYRDFLALAPQDAFIEPTWYRAYRDLVETAEKREGLASEARLVSLVGRTGMGKSRASAELIREAKRGRMVQAMPSWKTGYRSILWSLCDALSLDARGSTAEMERTLLGELKRTRHTLYLCELSRFNVSPKLIELLLLLLNQTRAALVLTVNPEGFDHLLYLYDTRVKNRQLSDGSGQFLRRGRVLGINEVDVEVALGLLERQFPGHTANAGLAPVLAAAGTALGGVDLVKEVVQQLHDAVTMAGAELSTATAEGLISLYRSRWQQPCKTVAVALPRGAKRAA